MSDPIYNRIVDLNDLIYNQIVVNYVSQGYQAYSGYPLGIVMGNEFHQDSWRDVEDFGHSGYTFSHNLCHPSHGIHEKSWSGLKIANQISPFYGEIYLVIVLAIFADNLFGHDQAGCKCNKFWNLQILHFERTCQVSDPGFVRSVAFQAFLDRKSLDALLDQTVQIRF